MGKKAKQSTKKFVRAKLGQAIKDRRLKQKFRRKDEAKQRGKQERAELKRREEEDVVQLDGVLEDGGFGDVSQLDVDSFLSTAFLDSEDEASGDEVDEVDLGEEAGDEQIDVEEARREERAKRKAAKGKGAEPQRKKAKKQESDSDSDSSSDSGSDSSSDEEMDDPDALERQIAAHQKELDRLAETDPDFHAHLQQEGDGLLEFADTMDVDVDAAMAAPATKKQKKDKKKKSKKDKKKDKTEKKKESKKRKAPEPETEEGNPNVLTMANLRQLRERVVQQRSIGALRKLLRLFRAACHMNDDSVDILDVVEGDGDEPMTGAKRRQLKRKRKERKADINKTVQESQEMKQVRAADSSTFNTLMKFCVQHMPTLFGYHLPGIKTTALTTSAVEKSAEEDVEMEMARDAGKDDDDKEQSLSAQLKGHAKWPRMKPMVKSFIGNLLHFTRQVTSQTMLRFILVHLARTVPFCAPFPTTATALLKVLVRLWSRSPSEVVRIDAFLRLRQLVLVMPPQYHLLEDSLKSLYLSYVRQSKFTNATTLPNIQFMANCVVELYGLDLAAGYQHAFVYIRQLAIHLRNAVTTKTAEAFKGVYNWQFINCLRVWAKVLATHGDSPAKELSLLVYPFVQVCIGVISLVPVGSRYLPLRLIVARFLNELAGASGVYIPLSAHLVQVFDAPELFKAPKKSPRGAAEPDIRHVLKVSKGVVGTREYHKVLVEETLNILLDHWAVYSYSISFPELVLPGRVHLKKFAKTTKAAPLRRLVSLFLERVNRNIQFVEGRRKGIDFAPVNVKERGIDSVGTFRTAGVESPLDQFVRLRTTAQKESQQDISLGFGLEDLKKRIYGIKEDEVEEDDEDGDEQQQQQHELDDDEDVVMGESAEVSGVEDEPDEVEELELSDDEDEDSSD